MILYQALSSYQILECILHRYFFHPEEKAVLLLGDYIRERMPDYEKIRNYGFFDEIYLFRYGGYHGGEETIEQEIEKELGKTLPYGMEEFRHCFIAGIHTYLQIYMVRKKISFEMFEDGSGALSRPEILAEIHKKSAPARYELIRKYGLYDHSQPLITKKYGDMKSQREGFSDPLAEDFNLLEFFEKLDGEKKEQIRKLFHVPFLKGKTYGILLLTQQFANLGQLEFREQVLIYQNFFDYFLEGEKVLIKPHPDDILYYGRLFPEAEVLRERFPSELLMLAFEQLPTGIATVSSTGVNLIRQEFGRHLFFNALYEKSFHSNHLCYAALAFLKTVGRKQIYEIGCNSIQLQNLANCCKEFSGCFQIKSLSETAEKQEALPEDAVILVDDWSENRQERELLDKLLRDRKGNCFLFLNSLKKYQMYSLENTGRNPEERIRKAREILEASVPVRVEKRRDKETGEGEREYCDVEKKDLLFIYCEEERIRAMALEFEASKRLHHTGSRISIEKMSDEEITIEMLKGILEATEQRLREYIRKTDGDGNGRKEEQIG